MAASFLSWWMVTHFETKIAVAHFYILHFNILGFQISKNSLTALLLCDVHTHYNAFLYGACRGPMEHTRRVVSEKKEQDLKEITFYQVKI